MTEADAKTGAVHADVVWHETHVTREQRQEFEQPPAVIVTRIAVEIVL